MEPSNAQDYIDQQIKFNKDVTKASTSMLEGLQRQAMLNTAIAQQLEDQASRLKTHRDLIVALCIMNLCSLALIAIGLIR